MFCSRFWRLEVHAVCEGLLLGHRLWHVSSCGEGTGRSVGGFYQSCCSVAESCQTLCDLVDCSPPGSAVHGILQARILEWIAIPISSGSQRRNQTPVSCTADSFLPLSHQGSSLAELSSHWGRLHPHDPRLSQRPPPNNITGNVQILT